MDGVPLGHGRVGGVFAICHLVDQGVHVLSSHIDASLTLTWASLPFSLTNVQEIVGTLQPFILLKWRHSP